MDVSLDLHIIAQLGLALLHRVCVCVRACVRVCVSVCVCMCVYCLFTCLLLLL